MKAIKKIIKIFLIMMGMGLVGGIGLFSYYAKNAPKITQSDLQGGGASKLYDTNGQYIMNLGAEKRYYVKYDQIPKQTKDAIISIEDKRFYEEKIGLDPVRIAKSVLINLAGRNIYAGGSTITQQLVKLSVFSTTQSDRTLRRKAQEAWLAMKISKQYSKKQILEYYINKVYMNYNIIGLGTAAKEFYKKDLSELDLAQTALLAGMPNAPISYDPYIYPKRATYRRNTVLKAMLDNKKITQKQFDMAINEPITKGLKRIKDKNSKKKRKVNDPYVQEVINEVKSLGYNPYIDNLKITVNLSQNVQDKLYKLANNGKVYFTNDKMQVAATVLDVRTGHVLAMIGGRKLPNIQLGLNRAVQTDRSSGSSIKPVLDYAPALEYQKLSTATVVEDTPYVYKGTNIQLHDWDNCYLGYMTMRYALEQSRNVPAVRTLEKVGLRKATRFTKTLGMDIPTNRGLSIGIGADVSTLQLAGAYAAFASGGIYSKPRFVEKIETPNGDVYTVSNQARRVMKPSTAYMINDMLKGVINYGSGSAAKIPNLIQAGKTGTVKYSENELTKFPNYNGSPKDSWFVGYTPRYVIAVWTGYDRLTDGKIDAKGELTAQLFYKELMSYLSADKSVLDWKKPHSVVTRHIRGRKELFLRGHAPAEPEKSKSKDYRYYYFYSDQQEPNSIPSTTQNSQNVPSRSNIPPAIVQNNDDSSQYNDDSSQSYQQDDDSQ